MLQVAYFPLDNLLFADTSLKSSRYSTSIFMGYSQMISIFMVQPVQAITTIICHAITTDLNHPSFSRIPNERTKLSQELLLYGKSIFLLEH